MKPTTMHDFSFDPGRHEYRIDGRIVPSVTQVLRDLVPQWQATEWDMQRGRAIHACAALYAQGKKFVADSRIDGHLRALREFFHVMRPHVLAVEEQVYSPLYQYAGTYDLWCNIGGRTMLVDWKSSPGDTTPIQLAAYALAHPNHPKWGKEVVLREDGTFTSSATIDLRQHEREWLALLGAYKVRQRLGCGTKSEPKEEIE